MKLAQIKAELQAEAVQMNDPHILEQDFKHVFASDLMSDALAMIHEGEHVLFLTGLANVQTLRTAEMLDIPVIIYVRNMASSIATSPPPITAVVFPLKNAPSHVAQ
mgnify:CR=1 FL=1